MLAGLRGGEQLIAMQFVGGRDIDGVDVAAPTSSSRSRSRMRDAVRLARKPRRARAIELITAVTSPPLARNAPIICSAAIVLAPMRPHRRFVMLPLPDNVIRAAPQEARTINVVGTASSPARSRRWRAGASAICAARAPRLRAIDGDAGQRGIRVSAPRRCRRSRSTAKPLPTATPAAASERISPIATTSLKQSAAVAGSRARADAATAAPPPE